jgi:hypothetical protein
VIVDSTKVMGRNVIGELAKIAISFLAILNELKVGVDVGFASLAAERTCFSKGGQRHLVCTLSIVKLGRLG